MKLIYVSPLILDGTGTINLTASQLGNLGVGAETVKEWEIWWDENGEICPEDFDVNNPETWEKYGFDLADPYTWENLWQFD